MCLISTYPHPCAISCDFPAGFEASFKTNRELIMLLSHLLAYLIKSDDIWVALKGGQSSVFSRQMAWKFIWLGVHDVFESNQLPCSFVAGTMHLQSRGGTVGGKGGDEKEKGAIIAERPLDSPR
jgi:hypothetical protein